MRETRAGKTPVQAQGIMPVRLRTEVLTHDFDAIEEAEEQHVSWINRGHSFEAFQPKKP